MQWKVLGVFLAILLEGCSAYSNSGISLEKADTWVAQHYDACLDLLFERPETAGTLSRSWETVVTVRRLSDRLPESQTTIATNKMDAFEVVTTHLARETLAEQMLSLYDQCSDCSVDRICGDIKIERAHHIGESPNLSIIFDKLEGIQVSLIPPSDIWLHADRFYVWITSGINSASFELSAPTGQVQDVHPLVQWCRTTLKEIENLDSFSE